MKYGKDMNVRAWCAERLLQYQNAIVVVLMIVVVVELFLYKQYN